MYNGRRPVRISRDTKAGTITVTLPLAERTDFPSVIQFVMRPNVASVRVVREESDKLGFVLTLNTEDRQECRRQLDRLFQVKTVMEIMAGSKEHDRTIEVTSAALTKATNALRQIAKFPPKLPISNQTASISISNEAVGPDVKKRRKTVSLLSRMADTTGRIPAHRFPQPHPKLITTG